MAQNRNGSITPGIMQGFTPIALDIIDCKKEREFVTNSNRLLVDARQKLEETQTNLEATIGLTVKQSSLMQTGANFQTMISDVDQSKKIFTDYEKLLPQFEDFVTKNPDLKLYCNVQYKNSKSEVSRYGLDVDSLSLDQVKQLTAIFHKTGKDGSVSSKGSKKSLEPSPHMLHPLEVHQFKQAVGYLLHDHRMVLADIFERNEDGSIKLGEDGKPGIHTVLLLHQKNSSQATKITDHILVIDPNNSLFSMHLQCNKELILGINSPIEFTTPSTEVKIYSPFPQKPIGPRGGDFRDCTDIAVKLAFELSNHSDEINIKKLEELAGIQRITNDKNINKTLITDEYPCRIRQASDDSTRETVDKLLKSIKGQGNAARVYKQALTDKIAQDTSTILAADILPDHYADQISQLRVKHTEFLNIIGDEAKIFVGSAHYYDV